jgi:hypothetical protein
MKNRVTHLNQLVTRIYQRRERLPKSTSQLIGVYTLLCMSLSVIIISKMQDVW